MRNIIFLILAIVVLMTLASCKKSTEDKCIGVFCQNGGTCVDGHCSCINGFSGNKCQTPFDSCSITNFCGHGTCASGNCNCDLNYTGLHCDQQISPIDTFLGLYHMVGASQTSGANPVTIDDTIVVTKFNDITLLINGYNLTYQTITADYYSYEWFSSTSQNYAALSFKKALDDSAFYEAEAGNTLIYLRGKKIQ